MSLSKQITVKIRHEVKQMKRDELIAAMYELTERERYLMAHPEAGPSPFYRFLEEHGYREENGVYRMPSIFLETTPSTAGSGLGEHIDKSPYQSLFRMKKATRFSREPLSYADFLCIRYVYAGELEMSTAGETFLMRENDVLLMNAGFVQSQHLAHPEDVIFTLMFERDYLVNHVLNSNSGSNVISRFIYSYVLSSENPRSYILFHGGENDRLPRLMEDMVMEYTHPTELGTILLESYLQILLVEMTHARYDYEHNRESSQSFRFAEIMDEIDRDYQTVTLQSLSEKYSYHPDYISRQIRLLTGRNFRDYLLDKRMEQVCFLLKNSDLPVSEIYRRAGFPNETHFYRKFQKRCGMTPKEYRKRHKGKDEQD